MSQLRGFLTVGLLLVLAILWGSAANVSAQQQPRPTPTYEPDSPVSSTSPDNSHGTIQGFIYEDVNGDGRCVDTGIDGEGPIAGVDIQFVSSDEQTIITLQSGPDGRYGLVAAGFSYWQVSAMPGADWIVTSDEIKVVPIYEDTPVATGINFCVQQAKNATVLLPASGDVGLTPLLSLLMVVGLLLFGLGSGLYLHRLRSS